MYRCLSADFIVGCTLPTTSWSRLAGSKEGIKEARVELFIHEKQCDPGPFSPAPLAVTALGPTHHSTGRCAIKPRSAGEFKRYADILL